DCWRPERLDPFFSGILRAPLPSLLEPSTVNCQPSTASRIKRHSLDAERQARSTMSHALSVRRSLFAARSTHFARGLRVASARSCAALGVDGGHVYRHGRPLYGFQSSASKQLTRLRRAARRG